MDKPSVRVEIDIHQTLAAMEFHAANYPADRLDDATANRLRRAADLITRRVGEQRYNDILARFQAGSDALIERLAHGGWMVGEDGR